MSSPPEFAKHDPATPEFWNVRFDADFMPWDQRGVPKCLRDYLAAHPTPHNVLIPGCGAAHEVKHFAEVRWTPTAIDFSPTAVALAKAQLGSLAAQVREADFFADNMLPGEYEVIYERAFLCALPRRMWADWAQRVAQLLARPRPHAGEHNTDKHNPGENNAAGRLIGFFVEDSSHTSLNNTKGPPFALNPGELEQLLSPAFTRVEKIVPTDSIPIFAGKESWQVWVRR